MIDCNEWRTEKRHECANMGKVKRLELWWQLYRTSLPVWDLENFRPMDFCWHECTNDVSVAIQSRGRSLQHPGCGKYRSHALHPRSVFVSATKYVPHSDPTDQSTCPHTRVGTLIVAIIYLQLMQNRYMFRSFNVLHCSHQNCVQPVATSLATGCTHSKTSKHVSILYQL